MIAVRTAVVGDAEGIKRVHVQAWRETYVGLIPHAVLDRREETVSLARWRSILESDGESVLVALDEDGRVVGFATRGIGRDVDAPYPNELNGLYTLREVQGLGVGRRLLELAVGRGGAYLWVLEGNVRAQGFYEHLGFVRDGAAKGFSTTGMLEPVTEVRMVRHPPEG